VHARLFTNLHRSRSSASLYG